MKNLEQSGQIPSEISSLETLELKANLNPEQRAYLEVLKDKMKKILGNKTKQELAKAGDLVALKNYRTILVEILEFLRTKEKSLEHKFELKKQYDQQFEILKETGVIKELSDGSWGMIDILDREQPIPSYEEIKARMEAKAELLDKKREQGLTLPLLVPIGMKLEDLAELAKKLILKKHQEGKLLATDGTALELNVNSPVYIFDPHKYKNADVRGYLVYYPKKFDKQNHGGKTKKELLEGWLGERKSKSVGWECLLIEPLADLPYKGAGKNIAGRMQFEPDLSPEQYLEKIQTDPQYANEHFTTPEAQLIYFMMYLQKNDKVIDNWQGKVKICFNAGAFLKSFGEKGGVPLAGWRLLDKRLLLDWAEPDAHGNFVSVRPSVII